MLNACVACVPALSSLTFLGEWHSFAQCPCLPQLWHLPLQHFHLSPSEPVTARASSVVSFFPPWPVCLHVRRLFNQSASSLIWLMRASMLIADALWTIRAEERMCDTNVASSWGIPWSMVRSYSLSVTVTLAAANSSRLQHRVLRKSRTLTPLAQRISRNVWWRLACAYTLLVQYSLVTMSHRSCVVAQPLNRMRVVSGRCWDNRKLATESLCSHVLAASISSSIGLLISFGLGQGFEPVK